MMRTAFAAISLALCMSRAALAQDTAPDVTPDVTLVIESWRGGDMPVWQETILPAFEAAHPGIRVVFSMTDQEDYDAELKARLDGGTAGDLISCRPFDASLGLFAKGRLADLTTLPGMENFSRFAKSAWTTDDGKATFCVPVASVIHGFIYNRDIFDQLGITEPKTEADFFAALDLITEDGTYIPLAIGTKDLWQAGTLGYQNIGPNHWQGEQGRLALIRGKQKLTDPQWVELLAVLARWKPYLGEGFETRSYADSQKLFAQARAAIYPAGSWDIPFLNPQVRFRMGAFAPPVKADGDDCYISEQADIGIGLNAASANSQAARTFLSWVASPDFAALYANALPGFFSLSSTPVEMEDALVREFGSWRGRCASTLRSTDQILSRGTPNLRNETWLKAANVINGTQTPQEAAGELQKGLDRWYRPNAKALP